MHPQQPQYPQYPQPQQALQAQYPQYPQQAQQTQQTQYPQQAQYPQQIQYPQQSPWPGWNPYGPAQSQAYRGGFPPQVPHPSAGRRPSAAVPMLAAVIAALLAVFWAASAGSALADPSFDEALVPVILLVVGAVPLVLGALQMFLRTRASRWVLLVGFVLAMPMSVIAGAVLYRSIELPIGLSLGVFGVLSAAGIFLSVVPPTVRYLDAVAAQQPGPGQQPGPAQPPYQQQDPQQRPPGQQPWYPQR